MAVILQAGPNHFSTATGAPGVGYKLSTYIPGTSTPKATYTTSDASVANPNPVVADALGYMVIYWDGAYDVVLKDASDALIWGPERLEEAASAENLDGLIADLASTAVASASGSTMVADKYEATGSAALNLHSYIEDGGYNLMGFIAEADKAAIRARTSTGEFSAQMNACMAALVAERGAGDMIVPPGLFNVEDEIIGLNAVGIRGAGMNATRIVNEGITDLMVFGDGVTDLNFSYLRDLSLLGQAGSGILFKGDHFATTSGIQRVKFNGGSKNMELASCYAMSIERCEFRSAVGVGIDVGANTHNLQLLGNVIQVAGSHGLVITGSYVPYLAGNAIEFNQSDQVRLVSVRGAKLVGNYIEGIQPTASGFAGVHVVSGDTVEIDGFFDATQSGPMGTNGTGTYVLVDSGVSRVDVRKISFTSIASSQTFVNFSSGSLNGKAVLPLGCTYTNNSPTSRVYHDDDDEKGVCVYNTAIQSYAFGAFNGLTVDTETYDPKAEFAANLFVPKDYGVFSWDVYAGIDSLAAARDFYLRLYNVTDAVELARMQFSNTGAGATTQVFHAHFQEFLTKGKSYQVQAFNGDTANRNSTPGSFTARQTIKRTR